MAHSRQARAVWRGMDGFELVRAPSRCRTTAILRRAAAICAVLALSSLAVHADDPAAAAGWRKLETGLDLGQFRVPMPRAKAAPRRRGLRSSHLKGKMVRSRRLELPRVAPLAPQASASTVPPRPHRPAIMPGRAACLTEDSGVHNQNAQGLAAKYAVLCRRAGSPFSTVAAKRQVVRLRPSQSAAGRRIAIQSTG